VPQNQRFCGACGADVNAAEAATRTSVARRASSKPTSDPLDRGRFLPGTMLVDRYRIVGLLGRGGMGEVYRADDVKLGQVVALKFLPEKLHDDPSRLERLFSEVRTARQVSHANVCRVYDIGDVDGLPFISMEYVDGEDLAGLLRRIGRLPEDKAVQMARQLCAGLAAAHEQGIVHRDLKPANVMIDGRGRVRITDFGLAGLSDVIEGREALVGTPAYMSPEQLQGKLISAKSDLYALGLVLYEMFTGERAFKAGSRAEMLRLQDETTPTSPSSVISGLDPAVERVVMRCLEKDPTSRPMSALAVAAALPGGDPLAAALAAGETPSPEMVADAGGQGALRPAVAVTLLILALVGVGLVAHGVGKYGMIGRSPLPKSPQALAERARTMLADLGFVAEPVDRAWGFDAQRDLLRHIRKTDPSPDRWDRLKDARPSLVQFWYRESPQPLVTLDARELPTPTDPPLRLSGMINLDLDSRGYLLRLRAVPPQVDETEAVAEAPDWPGLFDAAALDLDRFTEVEPQWNPEIYCDTQKAWTGTLSEAPDSDLRVEACAYRGQPVSFHLIHPWTLPERMQIDSQAGKEKAGDLLDALIWIGVSIGAALLARRNVRLGRGDRKGALRLAGYILVVYMIGWSLQVHHIADLVAAWWGLTAFLGWVLFLAGFVWVVYLAVEPFVRRHWPELIVSWTRLLNGRWRDPLVGKHILIGAAAGGVAWSVRNFAVNIAPAWVGGAPRAPYRMDFESLLGARWILGEFFFAQYFLIWIPMMGLILLVLFRLLLRSKWAAVIALVVLAITMDSLNTPVATSIGLPAAVVTTVLMVGVLVRFGAVAIMMAHFVLGELPRYPVTLDFSTWYAGGSALSLAVVVAIIGWGFYTSLGGQAVFAEE
jgi:serine/threonine-protein kinase